MRRRYVQINGELREVPLNYTPDVQADYHIQPDIAPYRSMIDGRMITSRSQHREHLRANNCIEIGNDSSLWRKPQPMESPQGLKETIARLAYSKLRY